MSCQTATPSPARECNKVHLTVEKKLDHTHGVVGPLMLYRNDATAAAAAGGRNFELTTSLGHVHSVYLTPIQLQDIVNGKVITVNSTVSSIPGQDTVTTAHYHAVQVQCNDPISFWDRHRTTLIILIVVLAIALVLMYRNRKTMEDKAREARDFFKGKDLSRGTPTRYTPRSTPRSSPRSSLYGDL